MTSLAVFAFVTGLHLALLQFGYLLLLQINVSSTYVTYAIVVASWMVGTLVGLWWQKLLPIWGLVIGALSYYGVYAFVIHDPLSSLTFPLAAAGVALTGLWAGRFFVVMLPVFRRADRLFFHENNGFLLGIASVFLGFTLLGRPFMLWTPLITSFLLVFHNEWIARRQLLKETR